MSIHLHISPYFLALVTMVFAVLKLTGVIAWSWWWVFSPLTIPFGIVVAVYLITFIIVLIFAE